MVHRRAIRLFGGSSPWHLVWETNTNEGAKVLARAIRNRFGNQTFIRFQGSRAVQEFPEESVNIWEIWTKPKLSTEEVDKILTTRAVIRVKPVDDSNDAWDRAIEHEYSNAEMVSIQRILTAPVHGLVEWEFDGNRFAILTVRGRPAIQAIANKITRITGTKQLIEWGEWIEQSLLD